MNNNLNIYNHNKTIKKDVMMKALPKHVGIIATHPMFGPDSYISNSNLKMMINQKKKN